jgi:tetrahydromethanopterin S-methyltransferase subunit D
MCDTPGLSFVAGVLSGSAGGGIGALVGLGLAETVALAAAFALLGEGLLHATYGWSDGDTTPSVA